MANSGMQLIGFVLALVGLAATIGATFMVEWKKQSHGKAFRNYEGLWTSCSGTERTTCDPHDSVLKLSSKLDRCLAAGVRDNGQLVSSYTTLLVCLSRNVSFVRRSTSDVFNPYLD